METPPFAGSCHGNVSSFSLRERDVVTDKTQSGGETLASVSVSPKVSICSRRDRNTTPQIPNQNGSEGFSNVSGLGARKHQSRRNERGKRSKKIFVF